MALVTLAQVRDVLNIPQTDMSHDAELQRYIDAATATVTYITGPLAPTTFVEVRHGGTPVIMLDNPPVISITSVVEYYTPSGRPLTLQPLGSTTDAFGYELVDAVAGKLVRRSSAGYEAPFWGGRDSIVITYVAGVSTVPADVVMATLEDIRGLYQQTQQGGRSSLGGGAIGAGGDDMWTAGPMHLFPRLNMLLEGPNRTQALA